MAYYTLLANVQIFITFSESGLEFLMNSRKIYKPGLIFDKSIRILL